MKRNFLQKVVSYLITMTIITAFFVFAMPLKANAFVKKAMNVGCEVLTDPIAGGKEGYWEGTKVYFGSRAGKNRWRVLDATTGLLFADRPVAAKRYDADSNDWETSELNLWLNGDDYKHNANVFTKIEQEAMSTDMTLLTMGDVTNTAYGFEKDLVSKTRSSAFWWWLRAPSTNKKFVPCVFNYGYVFADGNNVSLETNSYQGNVRPAFCLDLSSVLFTTASGVKKPVVSPNLQLVEEVTTNLWILTLLDESKGVVIDRVESKHGEVVIEYRDAKGEYLSMIAVENGEITYYGKIAKITGAQGTVNVQLPEGVTVEKLRIFSESDQGINQTKYASKPIELKIGY